MSFVLMLALALAGPQDWQQSYEAEAAADYGGAIAALERLPEPERRTYLFHLRRGWLRYLSGAGADAVADYQEAARLEPRAVEPLLGLSLAQMALLRWVDSEQACRAALEREPSNSTARVRLAWSLYNQGRFPEAETVYRELVAAYPSDVDLRAGLAWSLLLQGRTGEARVELEAVLAVAPNHVTARAGLDSL